LILDGRQVDRRRQPSHDRETKALELLMLPSRQRSALDRKVAAGQPGEDQRAGGATRGRLLEQAGRGGGLAFGGVGQHVQASRSKRGAQRLLLRRHFLGSDGKKNIGGRNLLECRLHRPQAAAPRSGRDRLRRRVGQTPQLPLHLVGERGNGAVEVLATV